MKYRVVKKCNESGNITHYYVQKLVLQLFYTTVKGPFPTEGDAQSWININVLFSIYH